MTYQKLKIKNKMFKRIMKLELNIKLAYSRQYLILIIYRKEVSWRHRKKFNKWFNRKYCSEEVISIR